MSRSSKFKVYADLRAIAEKPLSKRQELAIGRDGKQKPRRYHLTDKKIASLVELNKSGDNFPNPNNYGTQYFIIETLKQLGLNKTVNWDTFLAKFKELTSAKKEDNGKTFLQNYRHKESRNEDTGLNWEGRLEQVIDVMQRLGGKHPYGLKLLEVGTEVLGTKGAVIDKLSLNGNVGIRLNTNSSTPINEFKHLKKENATEPVKVSGKRGRKPKQTLIETPIVDTNPINIGTPSVNVEVQSETETETSKQEVNADSQAVTVETV